MEVLTGINETAFYNRRGCGQQAAEWIMQLFERGEAEKLQCQGIMVVFASAPPWVRNVVVTLSPVACTIFPFPGSRWGPVEQQ